MYTIYMRTSPAAEWRLYASLISTKEDAESMKQFLSSFNHGYEFRLECEECKG